MSNAKERQKDNFFLAQTINLFAIMSYINYLVIVQRNKLCSINSLKSLHSYVNYQYMFMLMKTQFPIVIS